MKPSRFLVFALILPFITACAFLQSVLEPSPTPPAADVTESVTPSTPAEPQTVTPSPPAEPASPTPTPPAQSQLQLIAYIRDGQLLVTDVTNSVQGGTTQYTTAGQNDQVYDLTWSPSGEFVAYSAPIQGDSHVFYIYALGQSSPTDLGLGNSPNWSPDSRSLAYIRGPYPDDNIWMTNIDNPAPRQLSFETNHAWGRPVFSPDGSALIVSTASRMDMGAQGNTTFTLERLALDGSGVRTPLAGYVHVEGARLPYDLRFSPDGTRLAFSASYHLSACASPGSYNVSQADGSNLQQFLSPSLKPALAAGQERYFAGLEYTWTAASDALVANGIVLNCDFNSPSMGQIVAGPQMSVLRLDGTEGLVIPGLFHSMTVDRSGTLVAAAHYADFEDRTGAVDLYSAQTGQQLLSLGPGWGPQFQP